MTTPVKEHFAPGAQVAPNYLDESGTGLGPFNPITVLADNTGTLISQANLLAVSLIGGSNGAVATKAVVITPGTPVAPGTKALINCSSAGLIRLKLSSGNTLDLSLNQGMSELDGFAVIDVVASSTTAQAVVTVVS